MYLTNNKHALLPADKNKPKYETVIYESPESQADSGHDKDKDVAK